MRIDIWSDVVCPWCFLGKRRFDTAVEQLGGLPDLEVRFRAFQLDPTATAEPGDLRKSLEAKYGPGAFDQMTTRLVGLGQAAGIDYRFDRALRVNTLDAHRLAEWAHTQGGAVAQAALVERLFQGYFEQGANVADHETLVAMAVDAGLDGDAARSALADGTGAEQVADDLAQARQRGVTGVPAFVIDDEFVIPGAQEVETFVRILSRIAA